jgi:hypothetical protein
MINHAVKLLMENKKLASIAGDEECEIIMAEVRRIPETLHTNSVPDSVLADYIL